MSYLIAFIVGGVLCVIGQLLIDATHLTPGHVMVLYVVSGAVLAGVGVYEPLVRFAGAGATVPVSNFGYVLTRGVLSHLKREGLYGALSGAFEVAGGALVASILFGFFMALLFHPRG